MGLLETWIKPDKLYAATSMTFYFLHLSASQIWADTDDGQYTGTSPEIKCTEINVCIVVRCVLICIVQQILILDKNFFQR